jgi:hypothetical protein
MALKPRLLFGPATAAAMNQRRALDSPGATMHGDVILADQHRLELTNSDAPWNLNRSGMAWTVLNANRDVR